MEFAQALIPATLLQRYKRFLADMRLADGSVVTAHCANPGSMLGLAAPGLRAWLSKSDNPARKLKYSWELVEVDVGEGPSLVGINTAHPNALVAEAVAAGRIAQLTGYETLRREVRYGVNSRIDLLLEAGGRPACYVEVKNVHLMRRPGLAEFPDSVTARGAKHLRELANMAEAGHRAMMVYLVQRADAREFALAADMDPTYAEAFAAARARGVEAVALVCEVSAAGIAVSRPIGITEPASPR